MLRAKVSRQLKSQYLNDLAETITRKCFEKCYVAGHSEHQRTRTHVPQTRPCIDAGENAYFPLL